LKKKKKKVEGGEGKVEDKGKGKADTGGSKALKDKLAMPPPAVAGKAATVA